jgi:hypothetical protein
VPPITRCLLPSGRVHWGFVGQGKLPGAVVLLPAGII